MRKFVFNVTIAIATMYSIVLGDGRECLAFDGNNIQVLETIRQFVVGNEELLRRDVADSPWEEKEARIWWKWFAAIKNTEITSPEGWLAPATPEKPVPNKLDALQSLFSYVAGAQQRYSGKKLADPGLYAAMLRLHRSTEQWLRGIPYAGWELCFADELWLADSDFWMAPYFQGKYPMEQLARCVPAAAVAKYPEFFGKIMEDNRRKIGTLPPLPAREIAECLFFNSYFGDKESERGLIMAFLRAPDFGCEYEFLLELHTPAALKAILSRFREETGAPDFPVQPSLTKSSPRHDILWRIMSFYPNDDFFVKYRKYLSEPDNLDSMIGGEAGVKQLFADLQKWAKERLDYDLDLTGASCHINLTPPIIRDLNVAGEND